MASLIDQYLGSADTPQDQQSVGTSLIDHYLSGGPAPVAAPAPIPNNVPTPEKLQQQWEAQGNQNPVKSLDDTSGLPVEQGYISNVAQNARGGIELVKSGFNALKDNRSAEATGKAVLGAVSYALSPITGALKTYIGDPVNKYFPTPSNTDFPRSLSGEPLSDKPMEKGLSSGDRAEFLLTSGLPVAKAGQMAIKALPTNKALTAVIDTIGKDNIADIVQQLKSNDRLSLMDIVPATRQMGQKLITTEGQHQNKFENFIQERIGSAKNATADIYDGSMGTPVNIVDKLNSLKQAASDVGKKEIGPAVKASGPVDISDVISNIDAKLKPGVNSIVTAGQPLPLGDIEKPLAAVRKFLTDDKSVRSNADSLHQFQSALRAKADDLLNSQSAQERQLGYALMNVRNDIVNAIDKSSPRIKLPDGTEVGSYKQGLSNFRDEKQVENAFQMGQLVTRNKLGRLEDSPEFWDNWVKGASPQELEAAREGARLAVQHQISGFKAGARKGQDILESEFNRDKLSSLFGKDEIDSMAKKLKDERNIAITNTQMIGNSQTAMRTKADSRVDLPEQPKNSLLPVIATGAEIAGNLSGVPGTSLLVIGGHYANAARFKFATLPLAKARNERITDLLTATGSDRDELIKILESQIPKAQLSIGSKARLALPFQSP